MTNQYIVQFSNNTDKEFVYGFAELFKTNNDIPVLNVRTCENKNDTQNQTLLYKFITNNFADISYNDTNMECVLNYSDDVSVIKFDKYSSSAYTKFKNHLDTLVNSKFETEYYPSGRVLYVGEVLYVKEDEVVKRQPNGSGIIYYDMPNHKIKYYGEFENGLPDGAGIFYDKTGNIKLKANNISKGVPVQKGKLNVSFKSKKEEVDVNFPSIFKKYISDSNVRDFVMSDNFLDIVASNVCNFENITFDELCFDEKVLDDKLVEIRKLLYTLKTDNDNQNILIGKLNVRQNNVLSVIVALLVVNMFLSLIR